jgi:hypothetical protein
MRGVINSFDSGQTVRSEPPTDHIVGDAWQHAHTSGMMDRVNEGYDAISIFLRLGSAYTTTAC